MPKTWFPAWKSEQLLRYIRSALLAFSALFLCFHFVHLQADFPNDSPWNDWSKYTDEGWYSDAAVRHYLFGHWYLQGDFNPAVAMPVWPLVEALVFRFTGVSLTAARAVAVASFVCMLAFSFLLLERFRPARLKQKCSLAASLATFLFCISPFFFVFTRMAILEPPLAALALGALLTASYLQPWEEGRADRQGLARWLAPQILLGLLLPAMVLTKPTAVALLPAVGCMVWRRAKQVSRSFLVMAVVPCGIAVALWAAYLVLCVRPHYWEDYQYLFSANAYTGFQLQPLATVLANTFADGQWMGGVLYPAFFVVMLLAIFGRPSFFRNPLVLSLLVWMLSYFGLLAYHNNLQPRYYLLEAVPVTLLFSLGLEELRAGHSGEALGWLKNASAVLVVVALAVPDILLQMSYVLHPEYTYLSAAKEIARLIRSDRKQSQTLLSVSGSDLTLMTGLPSIDDDFGTLDLDQRVRQYRPGWYVAWNEIDDDKMDALTPLYRPVRIAAIPAMDDPDRDQLILYRLNPAEAPASRKHTHRKTPRPLRTKLGQQPTTTQLQH